jgi:hypothetical protein
MPNDIHVTASAIAGFEATQAVFVALVKKGILSTAEAEAIVTKATEAIDSERNGDEAAELLASLLDKIASIHPILRK